MWFNVCCHIFITLFWCNLLKRCGSWNSLSILKSRRHITCNCLLTCAAGRRRVEAGISSSDFWSSDDSPVCWPLFASDSLPSSSLDVTAFFLATFLLLLLTFSSFSSSPSLSSDESSRYDVTAPPGWQALRHSNNLPIPCLIHTWSGRTLPECASSSCLPLLLSGALLGQKSNAGNEPCHEITDGDKVRVHTAIAGTATGESNKSYKPLRPRLVLAFVEDLFGMVGFFAFLLDDGSGSPSDSSWAVFCDLRCLVSLFFCFWATVSSCSTETLLASITNQKSQDNLEASNMCPSRS